MQCINCNYGMQTEENNIFTNKFAMRYIIITVDAYTRAYLHTLEQHLKHI